MLLLLALSACLGPERTPVEAPPASAPSSSTPAAPAAPAAETATAQEYSVTLDPKEMVYDEGKGTVTSSPDSDRQSATYSHYVLTIASVENVLGTRPTAPVPVVISATRTTEQWTPKDPNAPAPLGGFEDVTYTGVVLRKQ